MVRLGTYVLSLREDQQRESRIPFAVDYTKHLFGLLVQLLSCITFVLHITDSS